LLRHSRVFEKSLLTAIHAPSNISRVFDVSS
jgi:hypothetical protein